MYGVKAIKVSRRGLIITGIAAGGGLAVGYGLNTLKDGDSHLKFGKSTPDAFVMHAYVKIQTSGEITVAVPAAELGQGVTTSIPMIVAEELDAEWKDVKYELAPLDKDYGSYALAEGVTRVFMNPGIFADVTRALLYKINPLIGLTLTGGSSTILGNYNYLRTVGAAVRNMLLQSASKRFGVSLSKLTVSKSRIINIETDQVVTFGELAESAVNYEPLSDLNLKNQDDFTIIGKGFRRLDTQEKVDGSAVYGIDILLPNMLFASIRHCPFFGGKIKSLDASLAEEIKGVVSVVKILDNSVAVIAENTWIAQQALSRLKIIWQEDSDEKFDSGKALTGYHSMFDSPQTNIIKEDDSFVEDWNHSEQFVESVYETPYLAHLCMEPMGCTALYEKSETDDPEDAKITVWSPSQSSTISQWNAARVAGTKTKNAEVYSTLMGGGFGRRADMDFVREATALAKTIPGIPIKLTWSREEDVRHDTYRPGTVARMKAVINPSKDFSALDFVIVGKPVVHDFNKRNDNFSRGDPSEDSGMINAIDKMPYNLKSLRLSLNATENLVPNGNWRSVGFSHNAFYLESFIDEISEAVGSNPIDFRIKLLNGKPDHINVLIELARKTEWDENSLIASNGLRRGRGIAFVEAFSSIIAQMVQVTVSSDNYLTIDKVVNVVDPHTVINPNIVEAQIEGSVIDGLSAAFYGQIDVRDGQVVQSNFDNYRLMTLREAPEIETIVMPQGGYPGGIGEVGLPGVAPALANAIYDATGIRIYKLPISSSDIFKV